ncbi:MAG: carbohydrate ABC transporter permease [Anaerolineae bacterium]
MTLVAVNEAGRRPSLLRAWHRYRWPYLFISPFFISFAVFGLFPLLAALYLGFHQWDGMAVPQWVGLRNYYRLIAVDRFFLHSVANTLIIGVMCLVPKLILALLVAVAINSGLLRFKTVYQVVYFLPIITSPVAVAIVFLTIYGQRTGILNYALAGAGLPTVRWLVEGWTIKPAITLLVVWHEVGWYMVLYLAGLQSIPRDLYDAASVDGANAWGRFRHITLPMLAPVVLFTVVIDIIGELQLFAEPFVLVGPTGGMDRQGLTMAMYLYQNAFMNAKMGYAAAQAYVMFALIAALSLLNVRVFGRRAVH